MPGTTPLRRLRLGVDFHTFDGLFQGSRSHLLGLYAEVITRAPDIDFVFLVGDPDRLRAAHPSFASANVSIERTPHVNGALRLLWQLAACQRRLRLNLLHVQYRGPLLPAGPVAVTVHDTLFETHPQFFTSRFARFARVTGRRAVRLAALLFTVSDWSRGEMARLYGIAPDRIVVTPNAVVRTRFHPVPMYDATGDEHDPDGERVVRALGLEPGGYVLSVGRLEPRKNQANLVRAHALLPAPRLPLVLVGQRDFAHDEVFEEIARLGLQDEVRVLERVDDAALPALLRHARLFAYPSFAEGFGMPVVEAMASGVAVVTSDTTALAEVSQGAALTADPTDPAAIAAALRTLLADDGQRALRARAGVAAAGRYRWDVAADAFLGAVRAWWRAR